MAISYINRKLDKKEFPHLGLTKSPKKMSGTSLVFMCSSLPFPTLPFCITFSRPPSQMLCPHTVLTLLCGPSLASVPSHEMLKVLQLLPLLLPLFNSPDLW